MLNRQSTYLETKSVIYQLLSLPDLLVERAALVAQGPELITTRHGGIATKFELLALLDKHITERREQNVELHANVN